VTERLAARYSGAPMQPHESDAAVRCTLNGAETHVPAGTTIAGLLEQMRLRPEIVAVEVNARLVPRATWSARVVQTNERIEIVTLVGGG